MLVHKNPVIFYACHKFLPTRRHKKSTRICRRFLVGEGGFEPPKSVTTDLQSAPFDRSGIPPYEIWSWWTDSNPRPADYKSAALPAELHQQFQQQDLYYQMEPVLSTRICGFFRIFSGSAFPPETGGERRALLRNPLRRRPRRCLLCSLCGGEITEGESYWYLNGASVCERCFCDFARGELAPYRQIRGREAEL